MKKLATRAFVDLRTTQVHKTEEVCAHLWTYTHCKSTKPRQRARKCVHTHYPSPQNRDNFPTFGAPNTPQRSRYKRSLTKLALEVHWTSNLSEFPLRVAFARAVLRSSRSSRKTKKVRAHLWTYTHCKSTKPRQRARKCVHTHYPSPQNRGSMRAFVDLHPTQVHKTEELISRMKSKQKLERLSFMWINYEDCNKIFDFIAY